MASSTPTLRWLIPASGAIRRTRAGSRLTQTRPSRSGSDSRARFPKRRRAELCLKTAKFDARSVYDLEITHVDQLLPPGSAAEAAFFGISARTPRTTGWQFNHPAQGEPMTITSTGTKLGAMAIGIAVASSSSAQDLTAEQIQIDCDLPQAVREAVNDTPPPPDEVFNVAGDETFMGQVLRYERIQFASDARLILNSDLDFVVIAADELLFSAPLQTAAITLAPRTPEHGSDGPPGPPVADRGRHGHNGGSGQQRDTGPTRDPWRRGEPAGRLSSNQRCRGPESTLRLLVL